MKQHLPGLRNEHTHNYFVEGYNCEGLVRWKRDIKKKKDKNDDMAYLTRRRIFFFFKDKNANNTEGVPPIFFYLLSHQCQSCLCSLHFMGSRSYPQGLPQLR